MAGSMPLGIVLACMSILNVEARLHSLTRVRSVGKSTYSGSAVQRLISPNDNVPRYVTF